MQSDGTASSLSCGGSWKKIFICVSSVTHSYDIAMYLHMIVVVSFVPHYD